MRTAAMGCACLASLMVMGWGKPERAIAQTASVPSAWHANQVQLDDDADTILLYPDGVEQGESNWADADLEPEPLPYPDVAADEPPALPGAERQTAEPLAGNSEAEMSPEPEPHDIEPPILIYPDDGYPGEASDESLNEAPSPESGSPPIELLPPPYIESIEGEESDVENPGFDVPEDQDGEPDPAIAPDAEEEIILLYPDEAEPGLPGTGAPQGSPLPDASTRFTADVEGEFQVADVQIVGVSPELQQAAQEVIAVRPGAQASAQAVQTDLVALEGTGFFAAARASTVMQPQGVVLTYALEPLVVRSLQVSGSEVLPSEVVEEAFQAQINRPISPQLLNQGANAIDDWYREQGYVLASVVAWLTDPSGQVVVEVVEPTVGSIDIEFTEAGSTVDENGEPIEGRTREDFILRELDLQPGDIFNQNTVVQDLETLLRLGVFQDASVALAVDDQTVEQPPSVDIVYRVEEGYARNFRVGGGVSTELGLFGSVTYQDRNFRGIGEDLQLGLQAGGRGLEFNTGFTSPYRESQPNRLGYSINAFRSSYNSLTFSDEVPLANGDDARERRFGGGFSVLRPVGEWDAELGVDYARVSIRDEEGSLANQDEQGNQLTVSDGGIDDLLTLGFRVSQDRRINPFNPSGGSILSLSTEQSVPVGNGSILMNRLRANYARFLPVSLFGSGSLRNPEVLALNLQGGTILGELPPYEAFDLGGMNSVRGYAGGEVGSGRSYILASAEYRFPLFSSVGGVLFADLGSDLGTGSSVPGDPAGARDKPGTGLGYGFGIRVGSPLGLLRADFGFNADGGTQFHFGFGQRF